MDLTEKQITIPIISFDQNIFKSLKEAVQSHLKSDEIPVRFVITKMDNNEVQCEFSVLNGVEKELSEETNSIFEFNPRKMERTGNFNAVFLVPTGIGAEIGGHAGDATPVARVLAEGCDCLVTHPNVVNASDINEIPDNTLYVEGSAITNLLMGTAALQPVHKNRVLVIIDDHEIEMFANDTVNAVSAARATYGFDCVKVVKLNPPLKMVAEFVKSGRAAGKIYGFDRIRTILEENKGEFDAVALASVVDVDDQYHEDYFHRKGSLINPWGGVEAMLTHAVSMLFAVPTAHSPMLESQKVADFDLGLVEPRLAAEAVSLTFVQCMLKGLHRSPRIITDPQIISEAGLLNAADISCLVIPDKCLGLPTLAALEQGIPVIAVRENDNLMNNNLDTLPWASGQFHHVENYWEAAGVMSAIKSGISPSSMRRPLTDTRVEKRQF
tara:strand:+ start:1342 stop:2661 length:1320 start_codon:yes stop_codon:yes gene_type:complete